MPFQIGSKVKVIGTGRVGVIAAPPRILEGKSYFEIFFGNNDQAVFREDELSLETAGDPFNPLLNGNFEGADALKRRILLSKIKKPLFENLFSFMSSRTKFQVHQFKPLLKFLSSSRQKLLIADEVGLGKTIEAGIILSELESRLELRKVLVICPKSLCLKWQKELKKRFNLSFEIANRDSLNYFIDECSKGIGNIRAICSIQMLRDPYFVERFSELGVQFDLVIVDEAHHMRNKGTNSYRLGKFIAEFSDSLLFLTATPLNLGQEDFFNLINLLAPDEFSSFDSFQQIIAPNRVITQLMEVTRNPKMDVREAIALMEELKQIYPSSDVASNRYFEQCAKILSRASISREDRVQLQLSLYNLNTLSTIFTRTKKKDVGAYSVRTPTTIKIELAANEFKIYSLALDFSKIISGNAEKPGFVHTMIERQTASCIPATVKYLDKIISEKKIVLDEETEEDIYSEEETNTVLLSNREVSYLKELKAAFSELGGEDTKYLEFKKTLINILTSGSSKKIIIFAYFKNTLAYLKEKTEQITYVDPSGELISLNGKVGLISGNVDPNDRENIIADFWKPTGITILFSSEVGGEGLDLQVSNCVINYDLPWNPMVLEQRIGRIDRFGQQSSKILIYNFIIKDTIEDKIFLRLFDRIGIFKNSIGELEPLLGNVTEKIRSDLITCKLTAEEAEIRLDTLLIALEKQKKELERFDEDRSNIIGLDEFFTEQVHTIQKNKLFLAPDDINFFVIDYLTTNCPKTKIVEDVDTKILRLFPDKELVSKIHDKCVETKFTPLEAEFQRVSKIMEREKSIRATFFPETACEDPSLEFINLRHAFTKLAESDSSKAMDNEKAYLVKLGTRGLFFVYLINVNDSFKTPYMLTVLVERNIPLFCDKINKLEFEPSENNPGFTTSEIATARNTAESFLVSELANITSVRYEQNVSLIESKKRNITKSIKTSIEKLMIRLKNSTNEKITRMLESQIENRQKELKRNIEELELKRKIVISHELVCCGVSS